MGLGFSAGRRNAAPPAARGGARRPRLRALVSVSAWLSSPVNGSPSRTMTSSILRRPLESWLAGSRGTGSGPTACSESPKTIGLRLASHPCEVHRAVRFGLREIPDPGPTTTVVRPRPIVDVVEGLEIAPQACLLDSGATAVRFGMHVAELCGVDLAGAPDTRLAVGGAMVSARMARVSLRIVGRRDSHEWEAPVWFCEPWTPAFGLLGLTGFFDQFRVTIAAYDERIELTPAYD